MTFCVGIAKDASQADWSLHIEFYDGNQVMVVESVNLELIVYCYYNIFAYSLLVVLCF